MQSDKVTSGGNTSGAITHHVPNTIPPLIAGEDPAAYEQLVTKISAFVRPGNIIEEIWVQDVADLSWEVNRLRRLKAELLKSNEHRGLRKILDQLLGLQRSQELTSRWAAKEPEALAEVEQTLAAAGIYQETVMANTLSALIEPIERIDNLLADSEWRRNATIREISHHQAIFAEHLRKATEAIEVSEFEVLPSPSVKTA